MWNTIVSWVLAHLSWLTPFISNVIASYPVLSSIALAVGALRLVLKPAFAIFHSIVDLTPWQADNQILAKIEASKVYSAIVWALDYLASIKIIPPAR